MKTLQELIEEAKAAAAEGDFEKAKNLTERVKAMRAIQDEESAVEAKAQAAADEAKDKELADLRDFKSRIEGMPAYNKGGVLTVVEDETDKKAAKPFETFGTFMKAVYNAATRPHEIDERLRAQQKAVLGQNEYSDSDGGYLVQTDFSNVIFQKMHENSALASRCRPWPISSQANSARINAVKETSRATGSRYGGVQAYWMPEAGSYTASDMEFRQIELNLKKLGALVYATDEILADTTQLSNLMTTAVPEEMTFTLEDAILNGTGAGQPLGIMNSDALIGVAKETGQSAATILFENIIKMWARCWGRSRSSAVWLINQDIEPQLFTMYQSIGTAGVPVYLPANGLSQAPYGTLLGRPVIPVEYSKTLGTLGDITLVDFSQYLLATKVGAGIQQAQSIHVQFLTGQTAFRFTHRVDGQPAWESALTPYNGTNTLSPFVGLATRS